ncbi:DUF2919 domain-containing protein [Shewanella sp. WXL01]|uniref:DUF2919 domain-containing protein n=1 Tax=Shewanella maritima TaxID=2520507 RepID=A0A411PDL1_9GAMM|nr:MULTISPECIES: DUF2919 domain-containing protein [Shewanella]NKF50375.1 DUF2919 domain-containing protein [Shewanella sp. WXL01]QBF81611.1 DUF2919 domain-containing protein [Shewanella maritima]
MNFSHIKWLDDKGHVKPPLTLYLMLVFLARAWCVLVASLTQFNDQSGLVRLFYPQKSDFLLALLTGIGAVFVYFLIIAERKRKPDWLRPIFKHGRTLLLMLVALDAAVLVQRLIHDYFVFKVSYGLDSLLVFWSLIYLFNSKRLKLYFSDWHAQETEQSDKK